MYLQAALLEKQHSSLLSEQARLDAAVSISLRPCGSIMHVFTGRGEEKT